MTYAHTYKYMIFELRVLYFEVYSRTGPLKRSIFIGNEFSLRFLGIRSR